MPVCNAARGLYALAYHTEAEAATQVVSVDVITCARPWYLLLAQHPVIVAVLPPVAPITNFNPNTDK